jgi:hypothetical protein
LLATCPALKVRDCRKALEYATRACGLSQFKDSNQLDTLAAAYAENRQFDLAVETETEAIGLLGWNESLPVRWDMGKRLVLYKHKMAYREGLATRGAGLVSEGAWLRRASGALWGLMRCRVLLVSPQFDGYLRHLEAKLGPDGGGTD